MKHWFLVALLCIALIGAQPSMADDSFQNEIVPILKAHCYQCHAQNDPKGDVRLDKLSQDMINDRASMEIWHDALDAIQLGEMPPEDAKQLSTTDRRVLLGWIRENVDRAFDSINGFAEGIVLRRLNRAEYAYTMTDLLGLEMDYAKNLPPDPLSKDGFLNNGQALGMSSMQLQVYLQNARQALDKVLVDGEQPERITETIREDRGFKLKQQSGDNSDQLGRAQQWVGTTSTLAADGPFTVRVKVRTNWKEGQPEPRLGLRFGYFVGGLTTQFTKEVDDIKVASNESTFVEFSGRAEFWPRPEPSVPRSKLKTLFVLRNTLDDGAPKPKQITIAEEPIKNDKRKPKKKKPVKVYERDPDFPQIFVESVEFVMNDYSSWPPASHRQIVAEDENLNDPQSIRRVIDRFLTRAWRRQPNHKELDVWCDHFAITREASESDIEALRETLAASLASTPFLYLVEPAQTEGGRRRLTNSELASRLSYFLWSSAPDCGLLELALKGQPLSTDELAKQFDRMLAEPKSQRFVDQFCTQWLDLDSLQRVAINPQYYEGFDDSLKEDMVAETKHYFEHILRNQLSALQFLRSDFTMLNAKLAEHYGMKGPKSQDFVRVSLSGTNRPGGLLGHAATHMAGSDGVASHPIKRAVWIRQRLLNDPPAPPPPDVPDIQSSVEGFDKLTVREQLEVHRNKAACADCHRSIDPWGIAMEHYDAIGIRRDEQQLTGKPVDASTTLPGNHKVSGLAELQNHLLEVRKQQFAEALVAKLMIYALGRSLEITDQPVIDDLAKRFVDNGYKLAPLMREIVTSKPFLER